MYKGSFKKDLAEKQVLCPCVWDCLSTRAVELCGYDAALISGAAVAENVIGCPDLGIMTIDELVWVTEKVAGYANIPIIVDADEGYGDSPLNVARNVERLLKAGASGFTLDDGMSMRGFARLAESRVKGDTPYQVFPTEHWLAKIKAALDVLEGTDCVVIARTECRPVTGFEDAIDRCKRAQDLGAPMTMINRMFNIEECRQVAAAVDGWKMYPDIITRDGKPEVELKEIYDLGFNYVTMHFLEKGALYGMMDYGRKNFANKTTVYSDLHDMGGLTKEEQRRQYPVNDTEWLDRERYYHQYVKDHM